MLVDFYRMRIMALEDANQELREKEIRLVGFIFGTKYIGLLYGIVFLSHQIGSFFGAYLGGVFHDLYGSYDYAWYISIALSIFAGLIHLPIIEKQVKRLQTT